MGSASEASADRTEMTETSFHPNVLDELPDSALLGLETQIARLTNAMAMAIEEFDLPAQQAIHDLKAELGERIEYQLDERRHAVEARRERLNIKAEAQGTE